MKEALANMLYLLEMINKLYMTKHLSNKFNLTVPLNNSVNLNL